MCKLIEASRLKKERCATSRFGIIDSQSVKTIYGDSQRGIDGGKKIKGLKRYIIFCTQGHILAVHVHAANRHDSVAASVVIARALSKYSTIKTICGDAGYRGTAVDVVENLASRAMQIVKKLPAGWTILPKRWIVEHSFEWLNTNRRLSKDYEVNLKSSEI